MATLLPRSTPNEQGVSEIAITAFQKALENTEATLRGYVFLRHGKVVAEHYWAPYQREDKNWVYSVSKSFSMTAVGFAFDAGLIDIEAPVLSYFPEYTPEQPEANLTAMRVKHLLAMNTGHQNDTTFAVLGNMYGDWVQNFLKIPVENAPGTHFVYNTAASYMLSALVQRVTGETVIDYLRPRLFEPLGFGDVAGDLNPQGVFTGGWGFLVGVEDLAKLGLLYLNKGLYEGKRVLSERWVELATYPHSDNATGRENESPDWRQGYGFQLWRCQHGCYRADGAMGQYCVVFPEQDAVLALMSEIHNMQKILDCAWEHLLPGMNGFANALEQELQDKRFQKTSRMYDFDTLQLRFMQESLRLTLTEDDEEYSLTAGRGCWLDGFYTLPLGDRSFIPLFSYREEPVKISATFCWKDASTLEITAVYREFPHRERFVCRFDGENASFVCHSSVSGAREEDDLDFEGTAK